VKDAISFRTNIFKSTLVRPSNTTAYSAGDVLAAVTTNSCFVLGEPWAELSPALVDASAARRNSETQSGSIDWLMLVSSANATTKMTGEVWVFNSVPVLISDNSGFTQTNTFMEDSLVGVFPFRAVDWVVGNPAAGASGNAICMIPESTRVFQLPPYGAIHTGQLYAMLVMREAYTPVSGERITLRASVTKD